MSTLDNANVVLLPAQLNVAAIQQLWLVDQGILDREDFSEQSLFTPIAVNVKGRFVELLILPNQIQVAAKSIAEAPRNAVVNVVNRLVAALPSVQYSASGLNFSYWVPVNAERMSGLSRSVCIREDHPWREAFSSETSHFGFYASRDIFGSRLRADVKPAKRNDSPESGFIVSFNYHKDLASSQAAIEELRAFVNRWDEAKEQAMELVGRLEERVLAYA